MPTEPAPTSVNFPNTAGDEHGRVLVGGDLRPGTVLEAYRSGLFPMRQGDGQLAWWSPDPRGVLLPGRLRVSHSLRKSVRHFEIRVDTALDEVIEACASRPEGEYHWITDEIRATYGELHRLGWVHSVEAWADGELVGGLYGVSVGALFCGESMFQRRTDASKSALVALVELLDSTGAGWLVDVQWLTPHLASLGAVEVSRAEFLDLHAAAARAASPF
ncbi:MAG TPA: leucyl/phenylalanyl-tRNA--protein transferase [Nocardioidaceae bacterium]|nr:leucyl/phenylalanyl-tRNA--protein transferase [Nocardioidaceae bacterium]